MTDAPQTRYTRAADGTPLAYQVSGAGPLELVFFHWSPPIDFLAEEPGFVRVRRRLGAFSRTLWFDPRGMGASEGDPRDSRAGDVYDSDLIALFEEVGFQRLALVGGGLSGPAAIHFSVTHPDRIRALVLFNSYAHYLREDDYPWGFPRRELDRLAATLDPGSGLEVLAPSQVTSERFRAWHSRANRFRGGPDQFVEAVRASWEDNVRELLQSVACPTLVLHREANRYIRLGAGRYLAEHIPGARLVVLPGEDFLWYVGVTATPWWTRSNSF